MSKNSISQPITHHFLAARERPPEWTAIRYKNHREWLDISWSEYYRRAEAVGLGLLTLGVQPGDRVAILANTRVEWAALDFGIMGIGGVTVPVYQSQRADEIELVLNNCEAKVLILEDASQIKKWELIQRKCKSVEHVVCIHAGADKPEAIVLWDDFMNRGLLQFEGQPELFAQAIQKTKVDDLATLVYTSGTTGEPKGAMFTHRQILSEVQDIAETFPISHQDSTLSFLPYAHVLGRVELWLHTYVGFTLNFAESIDRLKGNLAEARPTVILGVPRIFEKIYAGLLTQIEGHPLRKRLFDWLNGDMMWPKPLLADWLLFSKLREGLGGRLRFVVSGGAPLEPRLADFFHRAGILLLEGYGLTETTAAIAVNTPNAYQFGTVGRPLGETNIKLAPDGEILVKSDKVMKAYYKMEQATEAVFQDGYFCTGDVGEWTENGFLRITDRKKDLIKTAGGKYVAPQRIEGLLKLDPLISNVLVHGDRRKYVVVLLTLNEGLIKKMARDRNWVYSSAAALTQLPEVQELVRKSVAKVNTHLASYETIKNFAILPEDFTIERGELTPSLKVKRKVCDDRYRATIDQLY